MVKVNFKVKQLAEIEYDFTTEITDDQYQNLSEINGEDVCRWIEHPDGKNAILNNLYTLIDAILDRGDCGEIVCEEKYKNISVQPVLKK